MIPICSFTCTHYTLDNKTLYYLLCKTNIIPLCEGKRRKPRLVTQKEFFADKEYYWGQIFDLNKIKSFVHGKKKFRLRLLSNGRAVSVLYNIDKIEPVPIDKQLYTKKAVLFTKVEPIPARTHGMRRHREILKRERR